MIALDMLIKLINLASKTLIFFLFLPILLAPQSFANESLEVEINNPRFSEKGLDNRHYEVKAERGVQKENNLELFIVEGKLRTDSGIWIYLNAEKGDFNQLQNTLKLSGEITFYTDKDEIIRSDYALFLINKDLIEFNKNVKHIKDSNVVTADKSTIKNSFDHIIYEGNVITLYDLD